MLAAAAYGIGLGLTRTPDPVKPDPDLTRSTRPRWYQPTPDHKPLWWRVTGASRRLAEGLEKKISKLLAVPPDPCWAGRGRLRFCRTPSVVRVMCSIVYGCASMPAFVRLILNGFCTACGVWGFLLVPVVNLRVTRFGQKAGQIRSISGTARLVRRRAR